MRKTHDLSGKTFGKLSVTKFSHRNKTYHKMWECSCSCGKVVFKTTGALRTGRVLSCGCLRKKYLHSNKKGSKAYKHGMNGTRFYNIYRGIRDRCLNKNSRGYKYYGARGITICNEWLFFDTFKADMYEEYCKHVSEYGERNTTIERIDNNLGYSKQNCGWNTWKEQAQNRRAIKSS